MIPPEPGPDPPTPTTGFNFEITNEMSQSFYFRVYQTWLDEDDLPVDNSPTDVSGLIQLHGTASFTIPELVSNNTGFRVKYGSTTSTSSIVAWNVLDTVIPASDVEGKTFKGVFRGNKLSNTWVIE